MTRDDISGLAHSKWNCKYHVVFAPKYRRMVIYKQIKENTEEEGVEIMEAEACIHREEGGKEIEITP